MKYSFLAFTFLIVSMSNAQDKLTFKTDEVIQAKIIRITKSKITYKKHSNVAGPEYEVDKKIVKTIAFENGDVESFVNSNSLPFEVKKSIISFNYGDFLANRFSFSYERLLNDGKLGIKIPFGVSYDNPESYNNNRMLYYSGLDLKFYPLGQRRLTYSVGFGSRVGVVNDYYYPYYDPYYDYYYYPEIKKRLAAGFYMNNGLTLHIVENMSISGMFGLGLRDIEGPNWAQFSAVGELNVSVRF
ncbi:hypothetical protein OAN33_01410 [Flavobacteriales bacterium]|nr:hypothetical protein [Flavobacteriales bacterium]